MNAEEITGAYTDIRDAIVDDLHSYAQMLAECNAPLELSRMLAALGEVNIINARLLVQQETARRARKAQLN